MFDIFQGLNFIKAVLYKIIPIIVYISQLINAIMMCSFTGNTGLQGPIGQTGAPGIQGNQGKTIHSILYF